MSRLELIAAVVAIAPLPAILLHGIACLVFGPATPGFALWF